ncbi:MAG: chemotaxis protein CheW [Planctomycetes bacterium]|nr:chemotaxis protein CheW [Planctomycetota bacterium]
MSPQDREAIAEAALLFDPADAAARAALAKRFGDAAADADLHDGARAAASEGAALLAGPAQDATFAQRIATLCETILAEPLPQAQPVDRSALEEFLTRAAGDGDELAGLVLGWSHGDGEAQADLRRRFHTLKGDAGMLGLAPLQEVCHAAEDALIGSAPPVDALLAACDWIGIEVAHLAGGPPPQRSEEDVIGLFAEPRRQLGEILVESGAAQPETVAAALLEQARTPGRRIGELLVERGAVHASDVSAALAQQNGGSRTHAATMRVEVDRVDQLSDAVGELGIAFAMLGGSVDRGDRRIATLFGRIERLLRTAQDQADRLRMIPVRPAFLRAERAAREAAARLGRQLEVCMSGAGTELDKAVVEGLADPLLHLVRNAVAHGIEMPGDRGTKDVIGRITLSAVRREGRVEIAVQDDGRGLDRARILAAAAAKGLPQPPAEASDREVWELIFLPGFSTSERVDGISGRGVGLDVVRNAVTDLRGRIRIDSSPGTGTSFTLVLPPTLAAVDGLSLSCGGHRFIVPTSSVRACVRPRQGDLAPAAGHGRLLPHQGRLLPWRPLPDLLGIGAIASKRPQAVVIGSGNRQAALAVDQIIGRSQAILKPVPGLPEIPGIAGASIGSDGRIELVLDPEALLDACDHPTLREAS